MMAGVTGSPDYTNNILFLKEKKDNSEANISCEYQRK